MGILGSIAVFVGVAAAIALTLVGLALIPQRVRRMVGIGLGAVILVGLIVLPLLEHTTNSELFTLTLLLTTVGVSINWNLTGGFTGYVDFGHAVWFGIGAYVTGILMSLQTNGLGIGWPFVPSLIVASGVAAVMAALIGRATMRLKGPYFSIAMLGTFVAMREIVRVSEPLTGGGVGLTLPPYQNRPLFYYVQLGLVVALLLFTWWLRGTRFGSTLVAIREDELGAEMRGINTTRNKVAVFTFSGFSTGLFGGLWAYQNTFIDPDIAFVEVRTIDAVMGTMLGGLGTVTGPVVGSAFLFLLRELIWANFLDWHLLIQGLLLIGIVLFLPKGMIGVLDPRTTSISSLWSKYFGSETVDVHTGTSVMDALEDDDTTAMAVSADEVAVSAEAEGGQ